MDEIVTRVQGVKNIELGEGRYAHTRWALTGSGSELDHLVMHGASRWMGGHPQFTELLEEFDRISMHELGHPEIVRAVHGIS